MIKEFFIGLAIFLAAVFLGAVTVKHLLANTVDISRTDGSFETEFMGEFTVTSYRSVAEQTDSSPFFTSIGERTNNAVVAVSRDLLKSQRLKYYDTICVEEVGCRQVMDVMHQRHKNHLDIWVSSLKEEQIFHKKFNKRKLKVWLVHERQGQRKS